MMISMITRTIANPPAADADITLVVVEDGGDCCGLFIVTLMQVLYGPIPAAFDAET